MHNDVQFKLNSGCSMKGVQAMRNWVEMKWEKGERGGEIKLRGVKLILVRIQGRMSNKSKVRLISGI